MWYMPYLRVRHAVLVYACIAVSVTLVTIALRFTPAAIQHMDVAHQRHVSFDVNLSMILAGSVALVGGFATVLGLNLAAENDGHLEVAWTKPVSREGYALGVFAVDIGAMAACTLLTLACGAIIVDTYAGAQVVTLGHSGGWVQTLAFCAFPLCVYGWIAALTASLKRNRGAVAGLFWPIMLVLAAIPNIPIPAIEAARPLLHAIDLFNPVDVFSHSSDTPSNPLTDAWGGFVGALLLVAAIVQWRRLQL